jgi:hypothetical protein
MAAITSISAVYVSNNPETQFATFHEPYLAVQPIPYRFSASMGQPMLSGGVLPKGQRVWLQQPIVRSEASPVVQAFVAGIGFVPIDPRLLKRTDGVPAW